LFSIKPLNTNSSIRGANITALINPRILILKLKRTPFERWLKIRLRDNNAMANKSAYNIPFLLFFSFIFLKAFSLYIYLEYRRAKITQKTNLKRILTNVLIYGDRFISK